MNLEKFEQYCTNQLSVEKQRKLEQEMTNNPDFFEDVENFKAFLAAMDQRGIRDIRTKLSEVENRLNEDNFFISEKDLDTYFLEDEADRKTIESKINSDPHYQAIAKDHQDSIDLVNQQGLDQFRKKIDATARRLDTEGFFEKSSSETNPGPAIVRTLSRQRIGMSIAAAILLALGFLFFLPKFSGGPSLNYVWTQTHLDEAIADSRVVGLANTQKVRLDNRASILALVKNEQYEEAVAMWQRHLERWPDDQLARFYYAHCLRENQQYSEAIEKFETLRQDLDFIYSDDVLFHLALCYLQSKEGCQKGGQLLDDFISEFPTSTFHTQALVYRTQFKNCP